MKCPRQVRHYCNEMAILTQKLMLPFRCTSYLLYLGEADLYSKRLDDCNMKLNSISDILCFDKINADTCKNSEKEFYWQMEQITNDLGVLHFDVPKNKENISPSSPVLNSDDCKYPPFIHHDNACVCFYCVTFEYQNFVLKKVRLAALLNLKRKNYSAAKKFLYSGLNMYQLFSQKIETCYNKNIIHRDLLSDLLAEYVQSYGQLLFDFAKFLMNVNNKVGAEIVNKKLIALVEPWKHKYMYLYRQTLLQKLSLLTDIPRLELTLPSPDESSSEVIIKTPESKHNQVRVCVQKISPCSPILKLPSKKRLQFEASPENQSSGIFANNERESCKRGPTDKKELLTSRKELSTVKKERLKLPASKIKIYTEDDRNNIALNGRVTRAKAAIKKTKGSGRNDKNASEQSQTTNEVGSSRRKLPGRKNLLGELNV